jgi:hypothetical protein
MNYKDFYKKISPKIVRVGFYLCDTEISAYNVGIITKCRFANQSKPVIRQTCFRHGDNIIKCQLAI